MKSNVAFASIAVLAFAAACSDPTPPITQDQSDEIVAIGLGGADVDPNTSTNDRPLHSPAVPQCTYDATTKWHTCGPTTTPNGLTVTRQHQFLDSNNVARQWPDSTTRKQRNKTTITGTLTMHAPPGAPPITGTTTVVRNSDETVTGMGPGSTTRVANGTGAGTENSQFTDARGAMIVTRTYADTTSALTFPAPFNPAAPWPTAGTKIRNITAVARLNGGAPNTFVSREVHTFAAGGRLTIVTTMNNRTRTCQIQLVAPTNPPTPPPQPVCTETVNPPSTG
jgi:hypothetical protein